MPATRRKEYRLRLERDGDRVRLITRDGFDWTKRCPGIFEAALNSHIKAVDNGTSVCALPVTDGSIGPAEAVDDKCVDRRGVPTPIGALSH